MPDKPAPPNLTKRKKNPSYKYLAAFVKYTLADDEELLTNVMKMAVESSAPDDTVMWSTNADDTIRWVTREEVRQSTPIFLEVLEDRLR